MKKTIISLVAIAALAVGFSAFDENAKELESTRNLSISSIHPEVRYRKHSQNRTLCQSPVNLPLTV